MSKNQELVIPVIVLLLLGSVSIYFSVIYLDDLFFYRKLFNEGIETGAVLVYKGVEKESDTKWGLTLDSKDSHYFIVKFEPVPESYVKCKIRVSKNTFYAMSRRDQLSVVYIKDNPAQCTLPNSVTTLYTLSISIMAISLFFLLIFLGFLAYVVRSFRKPKHPLPLTTQMNNEKLIHCPECGEPMTEGYMPTIGGVSWRDREEAVGIPTLFSGLPGTTFWFRRPMLHGFHCKNCRVVTFKYGKKSG